MIAEDHKIKQAGTGSWKDTLPHKDTIRHDTTVRHIGASGSVLGIISASACVFPKQKMYIFPLPLPVRLYAALGAFGIGSAYCWAQGLLPSIGHTGHLGGMAFGIAYYFLALKWRLQMEAIGLAAGIVQLVGLTTKTIKSLGVESGPLDQLRNALQQLIKRPKPKEGIGSVTSALAWDLNKSYCLEVLDTIERAKSRVTLAFQDDTLKLTQAIKEDTARIGTTIDDRVSTLSLGIDGIHQKCDLEERRTILEWLSPLNFYRVQQDISARREADTGQWFPDAPEFQKWTYGANNTLCCPGMPGAGKSILASLPVDFLRQLPGKDPPIGVEAVYCNFKDQEQQTLENLLTSVCVQLLQESSTLPSKLMDLYETCSSKGIRPGLQKILPVFRDAVNACGLVYLVVDALDECMEEVRNDFISNMIAISLNLKLLVKTRYIDSIMNRFTSSPQLQVRTDSGDLNKYIRSRIQRLAVQVQPQVADEICRSIIAQADGMFLVAKLHVDSLASKASMKTLKQAVKNLSGTLNDLYDNAIQRIHTTLSHEFRNLAKKALHWVASTYRPLPVDALLVALAIEPGEKHFDPDGCPSISLVLDICAGLLILDEQSKVIRLVHYTLQDYVNAQERAIYTKVHCSIARICMTYLDFGCTVDHSKEIEE
ncbi:MAG: hypothetical protein Q9203_005787 [Teloschistes exilis]